MSYNQGSQPSGSWVPVLETSENNYRTMWETNDPIDVDSYVPIQTESLPIITKVESISSLATESVSTPDKVLRHVCNALGLDSNQSMQKIKAESKKKFKHGLLCHPNLNSPKAATCKSIFITQLPFWFEFCHVKTLIQIRSDFDVNWGSYYIDMFKNVHNQNTGECLLRFMENKDCIQVFTDLQSIIFADGPVTVNLDLGHEIANERDRHHPNFEEQLRKFNENGKNIIVKQENIDDNMQYVEPKTIDFDKIVGIKIEEPGNVTKDSINIKQKAAEEVNTREITLKEEERVSCMDIGENTETRTRQDIPIDSTKKSYHELYKQCRIVHVKNFDPDKFGFFHSTLNDYITKTMGKDVVFECRKVFDGIKTVSGDVLIQFTSHRNAEIACKRLNSSKSLELKYITARNAELEAVMGVGYSLKSKPTTTDLRLYQLKRKLMCGNGDDQTPTKKAKVEIPAPGEDYNTIEEQQTTTIAVTPEGDNNTNKGEQASTVAAKEVPKEQRASTRTNRETTNKDKTSRASDYQTGVMVVDERDFTAFGLRKEFLHSLGLKMPFSRTVIVSHLHPDVSEAKLMEVFSLAGEVNKIDYTPSLNEAKIEYDHALEAVQAVSMLDKQKLYNRPMFVKMDEVTRRKTLPQGLAGVGQGLGRHGHPLRGVRIQAELRRLSEMFVDLGTMEKEDNDNTNAYKFSFNTIKPKDRKTDSKSDRARDLIKSAIKDSRGRSLSKSSNSSDSHSKSSSNSSSSTKPAHSSIPPNKSKSSENSSKDSNKSSKSEELIPDGTLLAIQALGTVLVTQGLIPPDTNCKSLQCILGALQNKTAAQQNLQNTKHSMNICTAGPNPGLPNRSNMLNQAISDVMQLISSNAPQSNLAPNIQNVAPMPMIPAQHQPIPRPVPTLHPNQGNIQPVAPYENPSQARWDILNRTGNSAFPVMPVPVEIPLPTGVAFAVPARPTNAPQSRSIQPAYDHFRTNLRAIPTCVPILPQPSMGQPSHLKPEDARDFSKEKHANHTKASLEKYSSRNRESLEKSEMLVFKDLPPCVTAEVLQGKMKEVGELKFCQLTGKGRAFAQFEKSQDADRCIRILFRVPYWGPVTETWLSVRLSVNGLYFSRYPS